MRFFFLICSCQSIQLSLPVCLYHQFFSLGLPVRPTVCPPVLDSSAGLSFRIWLCSHLSGSNREWGETGWGCLLKQSEFLMCDPTRCTRTEWRAVSLIVWLCDIICGLHRDKAKMRFTGLKRLPLAPKARLSVSVTMDLTKHSVETCSETTRHSKQHLVI